MYRLYLFFSMLLLSFSLYPQKDSLLLGDRYAEDQIYASISYAQFYDQPSSISKSGFSFALSSGFIKDFILNKKGNFSFALGLGYGFDSFNHELKLEKLNNSIVFSSDNSIADNAFTSHNLEIPLEIRWRTSTAKKYDFWRIYAGIKFLYNISNQFKYTDANAMPFVFKNIESYRKLQYGLTLSAGYDEFNINVFYGLTPVFENAKINGEQINTKILKFGLVFYIL